MNDLDVRHMRRALELAKRGWGRVAPNPMVGAVIVRDGVVVGEGYHAEWGGPHAEVAALRAAWDKTRGATLYVSLEPCHHHGKTGPCSHEIKRAGIARVVCAASEVNPEATGGAEWLLDNGVEVSRGVCESEAEDLNAVHFHAFRRRRPFLALKYALTLDAKLSEGPGRSSRITGAEAVREAHRLRAGHDAVMVGIGTARVDDPQLTVREWLAPRRAPLRAVLDSGLRLPPESRLVQSARDVPVWVFGALDAPSERAARLESSGVSVIRVKRYADNSGLDLGMVLAKLWERNVTSVLCEGGGRLGSAWLASGYVDRLYAFVAPRVFGEPGVAAFQGERGRAADEWRLIERQELGSDTLLVMSPAAAAAGEDV
jgi:diaminohydroxyphosphoribosylaminopyrimidine deaminase/5-amino-6-(5-phosphoribosylamino)uracil reductase